jgi:hypothetical protein
MVEHLLRFVSRSVEKKYLEDLATISSPFLEVLKLSFNDTNRENVKIIEEILPISARFIFHYQGATQTEYFEILANMMNFYSQADQKDNLRFSCVEALEYLIP